MISYRYAKGMSQVTSAEAGLNELFARPSHSRKLLLHYNTTYKNKKHGAEKKEPIAAVALLEIAALGAGVYCRCYRLCLASTHFTAAISSQLAKALTQ